MTEIKTIINVCKKITELLKEDIQKLRRSRQHKAHKKPDPNESEITEMKLLVHESQAGAIIGPKGSHVKKINEKTGAKINVHTEICPKSTEKVVQVTGKIEAVTNAIGEILVLFNDFPPKGNIFPYDPNNFDPSYDYGGYGFSPNTMQNINNNGNNNNNNLVHNNNNTNNNRINLNQNGNLINNHSHSIQNLSNAHSPLKSFQGLTITANSTNKSNLNLMNMHAATPVTTPLSINTNTNHSNHNFGGSAKNNNNFSNLRRGTAPDIMNGISSLASGFQKMAPFRANNHHHNNHNNNNTNFLQNHLPNNNNLGIPLALQPGAMLPGHPQGFPTGPAGIPGLPVGFINPSALGGQQSNHPNTTAGQPPSMDPHSYSSYNSMGGFSRDNDNNGHHHHHHHNNNNNTSKSKDSGENHTNANNLSKLSDNSFTEGDSHMANGNSNKNKSSDSNNNNNNSINQLANTNNNTNLNNVNLNNKPSAFPAVPGYPYNSPFFPPAYFMYNGQLIPGPGHPDNIGNPLANNFAAGAGAAAAGPQFTTSMTMANPQGYMPPNTGFNPFATNQSNQNNNNNNNHLHQQGQSPQLGHSILDRKNTADS